MMVGAASKHLGVAAGTIRNWIETGTLRAKRHPVNGYRMILKADIDALSRKIQALPTKTKRRSAKPKRKPA